MKSLSSKKKIQKPFYIIGVIFLLICVGIGVFYLYNQQKNSDKEMANERLSTEENIAESKKKKNQQKNSAGVGLPNNSETITSDQIPQSSTLSISILSTSQENGKVTAAAQTNGEGTCVFSYTTDGDKPVINQVAVQVNICQSSISEVQFAKLGVWSLKVTYYNNEQKAEAQANVTIR